MKFDLLSILSAGLLFASAHVAALPPSAEAGVLPAPHARPAGTSKQVETTANFSQDALARAQALGVDPNGPMPEDFDKFDGKAYHFSGGSKFAAWVAAQTGETALARRQSGVSVAAWTSSLCDGSGILWSNMPVNTEFYDGFVALSMQIIAGSLQTNQIFLLNKVCTVDVNHSIIGFPGCASFLPAYDCFDFITVA